uniref:Cell growth-regulating nucleolar protein-like winged helix domain-containing protein n=1 Tax=Caenorhabditis japonica TaxID=281687 RepID=A0A8R1IEP9_CAEJA
EKKEAALAAASKKTTEEQVEQTTDSTFKWKKVIKRKLKDNGGEMKIKKLKKAVLEEYSGDVDDFDAIFDEKLQKCGAVIDGKKASLAA